MTSRRRPERPVEEELAIRRLLAEYCHSVTDLDPSRTVVFLGDDPPADT